MILLPEGGIQIVSLIPKYFIALRFTECMFCLILKSLSTSNFVFYENQPWTNGRAIKSMTNGTEKIEYNAQYLKVQI